MQMDQKDRKQRFVSRILSLRHGAMSIIELTYACKYDAGRKVKGGNMAACTSARKLNLLEWRRYTMDKALNAGSLGSIGSWSPKAW